MRCAHHGITNIFEGGRKAIDGVMHEVMNITEEQQASDTAKVKAMRTCVPRVTETGLTSHTGRVAPVETVAQIFYN